MGPREGASFRAAARQNILRPPTPYRNRLRAAVRLSMVMGLIGPSRLPTHPDLDRRRWRLLAGRAVGLGLLLGHGGIRINIWGRPRPFGMSKGRSGAASVKPRLLAPCWNPKPAAAAPFQQRQAARGGSTTAELTINHSVKSQLYKRSGGSLESLSGHIVAVHSAGNARNESRRPGSHLAWRYLSLGLMAGAWPRGPPGGPHTCTVCRPQF
jgi:hypothetical protein